MPNDKSADNIHSLDFADINPDRTTDAISNSNPASSLVFYRLQKPIDDKYDDDNILRWRRATSAIRETDVDQVVYRTYCKVRTICVHLIKRMYV